MPRIWVDNDEFVNHYLVKYIHELDDIVERLGAVDHHGDIAVVDCFADLRALRDAIDADRQSYNQDNA